MSSSLLLSPGDPRLAPSTRPGDVWAAIAPLRHEALREERARMRRLLEERPDPLDRRERPGHFTGSALVVDGSTERTLMLFHTKLQIWVQPGGHADGDANLAAVALREAVEETGIEGLRVHPEALDLDVHRVEPPHEDGHLHYDVRFLVIAPEGAEVVANQESQDQRWVGLDELHALGVDPGTVRMARNGLEVARSLLR